MKIHLTRYTGHMGLSVCGLLNNEGRKNRANILRFYDKSNFELIWENEGEDALCAKCFEAYKEKFPNAYYNRMKRKEKAKELDWLSESWRPTTVKYYTNKIKG